jgi:hypothetical protein
MNEYDRIRAVKAETWSVDVQANAITRGAINELDLFASAAATTWPGVSWEHKKH